jgi:cell division protein FtsI (penicillin-binding protein 3)
VKDSDLDEASPDHLGSALDLADANPTDSLAKRPSAPPELANPDAAKGPAETVALRQRESLPPTAAPSAVTPGTASSASNRVPTSALSQPEAPANGKPSSSGTPSTGTVVLEVEQGGIEVPNFMGKSVRAAIEAAEESQLELTPLGSGVAREQSPAPGSHVAAGTRILVKFER